MNSAQASAPAKVILTGEHAVVHHEPALVMAIDRRAYVTVSESRGDLVSFDSAKLGQSARFPINEKPLQRSGESEVNHLFPYMTIVQRVARKASYSDGLRISIRSDIPSSAGLGSSAAIGVAMSAALGSCLEIKLSKEEISKTAFEAEKLIHGHPSGIDNLVSTYGGLIVFRRNEGFLPVQTPAKLQIIIGMTGIERSTGEQVAKVAETVEAHPQVGQLLLHCIGHLTIETVEALREGEVKSVGKLLSLNHWLVNALGVSNSALDRLVYASLEAGALGAKLTGAGGGGCMIALVTNNSEESVKEAIQDAGGVPISAKLSQTGVRIG